MKKGNCGAILPTAMVIIAVTASVVAMAVAVTAHHSRQARRVSDRNMAIGYGDGVIENLFDQWRGAMSSVKNATDRSDGLTTRSLSTRVAPPGAAVLPPPAGISLVSWSIYAADPFLQPLLNIDQRPVPENGTPSRLRVRQHYLATIKVRFGSKPTDVADLQRVFIRAGRNVFDDFFFGTQPITEYAPGPDMYVDGSVYVGGDLYTPNDSLHFLQNVTFTGNQILDFRPNDPHRTAPDIAGNGVADNWSPSNPPRQGQEQKLFDTDIASLDPNFLDDPIANDTDSDGNLNNDGYHELIETAVPGQDPLQLDASTSERLSEAADYRIFIDANNNVKIYTGASPAPLSSGPEYLALMSLISTDRAIKDVREKDYVRVATLDVDRIRVEFEQGVLKDTVGSGDGLLLYVADTSTGNPVPTKVVNSSSGASTAVSSARSRGIRLKNGGQLPDAGLTIVSPNAIYVEGDYNSGRTSSAEPESNTATNYTPPTDRPSPVVSNYQNAPAAIIGDAVNILSNAWNDANSMLPQSSRRAVSSTVNAAIVAGNVPTTVNSYSGGVENFVRFHENWSGRYFTISGALAQLYSSEQARGLWKDADYTPPSRRWYYDDLLRDRNPPGMRVARSYARGGWTIR